MADVQRCCRRLCCYSHYYLLRDWRVPVRRVRDFVGCGVGLWAAVGAYFQRIDWNWERWNGEPGAARQFVCLGNRRIEGGLDRVDSGGHELRECKPMVNL